MNQNVTPHPAIRSNGAAIRSIRSAQGWTLTKLARALGVSHGYLSKIEAGYKNGSPPLLTLLAEVLGVPLAAITSPYYELDKSA